MFDLTGKTAIITGGGSGIGKAMAIVFAKQGANVYVLDLDENGASQTIAEIKANGNEGTFIKCNVASQAETGSAINRVQEAQSSVDILINNAGIAHVGTVETTTEADFDRLYSVNIKGVYNATKAVIPFMKSKGGSILHLASIASTARVHTPFVDGFIAKNYPGKEDEMFKKLSATQPIGRMGRPREIAYLALYLCSDEASFLTGCDYPIDGGFTKLNN